MEELHYLMRGGQYWTGSIGWGQYRWTDERSYAYTMRQEEADDRLTAAIDNGITNARLERAY